MIKKIKKFMRTFPLTRGIWCRLSDEKVKKIRRDNLQKNGVETVKTVQEILESTGVFFFFDMGTLLGIVREGRLLRHDMDIDIAAVVGSEEEKAALREALVARGCAIRYSYSIEELGTVEESFMMSDIKFDINYYIREDDRDVCYLMYEEPGREYKHGELSVVKLSSPHISVLEKKDFNGTMINVPKNAEDYLAVRYGENWRIPDKGYVYWKGPSTSPTDFVGHVTYY